MDWNMPTYSFHRFAEGKEFSTIEGCFFWLVFESYIEERMGYLKLIKILIETDELPPSLHNLDPGQVSVSKEGGDFELMSKGNDDERGREQWGPVYWDIPPERFLTGPIHFRVVLNYEPLLEKGKVDILNHLGNLLDSGTGSDVEFIVQGEKMKGHTLILRGGSPVLAAMFQTDATSRTVIVEDVEPHFFSQLLRYLYTGDVHPAMEDMAEDLLIAAAKYQVNSLKNWCGSILSKALNKENVLRLLVLSHLYPPMWLQEDCIEFIVKNKGHFFKNEGLRAIGRNYPDLFFEVTKRSSVTKKN